MATSGGFHAFFQEVSEYDIYVFWIFVGGINLVDSRSAVTWMILFTTMRQQSLRMYQIVNNDVTLPKTSN